jgi:hypothetical protein
MNTGENFPAALLSTHINVLLYFVAVMLNAI